MSSLVKGVQLGMAAGEAPIRLVTPNVQLAVISTLVTNKGGLSLPVPPTMNEELLKTIQPKITLGPRGLSSCMKVGSYAQLSVHQWSVNPYKGSRTLKSPLLAASAGDQTAPILPMDTIVSNAEGGNRYPVYGVPAYFLSMQFSDPLNFDFEQAVNYTSAVGIKSNYTMPACTQYDGSAYVPCRGCNISSYTNYNVTYSCYDITQICPTTSIKSRYLEESFDDDSEDSSDLWGSAQDLDNTTISSISYSRRLQSATDDGDVTSIPATYGVLEQSIAEQFSNVLSSNPFFRPSTTVLIFVGSLSGFICLMLLCLVKRDNEEKMRKSYLNVDIYAKARKLLEEDIRNGRSGDHSVVYERYLTTCKRETVGSTDVVSNVKRTSSRFGMAFSRSDSRQSFADSIYPSVKNTHRHVDKNIDSESVTDSGDYDYLNDGKSYESEAAIIEFLHILFPGRAIFKKSSHALDIIAVNHDYFKMFGGSTMTQSRTIRFLELVVLVLVTLFVDTVFFGIFYPVNNCNTFINKVSNNAQN
jgi:hypothetical protein